MMPLPSPAFTVPLIDEFMRRIMPGDDCGIRRRRHKGYCCVVSRPEVSKLLSGVICMIRK